MGEGKADFIESSGVSRRVLAIYTATQSWEENTLSSRLLNIVENPGPAELPFSSPSAKQMEYVVHVFM